MAKKKAGSKSTRKLVDEETGEIKEWEDIELQEALIAGTEEELLAEREQKKEQAGMLDNVRDVLSMPRRKRLRGVSSFGGAKRIAINRSRVKPLEGSGD